MGDRGNVVMHYTHGTRDDAEVYLYTHWHGAKLPQTVAKALDRGRDRWDDEAYLARIIFEEMTQGSRGSTTGFGIAPYAPDEHDLIHVYPGQGKVNDLTMEEWINRYLHANPYADDDDS